LLCKQGVGGSNPLTSTGRRPEGGGDGRRKGFFRRLALGQLAFGQLAFGQLALGQLALGQLAFGSRGRRCDRRQGADDPSSVRGRGVD
jgi:hypothetical protein